jgi:hypothetical protein
LSTILAGCPRFSRHPRVGYRAAMRGLLLLAAVLAACGGGAPADLGATLPKVLAGESATPQILVGESALGDSTSTGGIESALRDTVARVGKTPADVTVARETVGGNSVFAFRVAGADGATLLSTMEKVVLEKIAGVQATGMSLGGKSVRQIVFPGGPTRLYLYGRGDVVYLVATPEDAIAAEALRALP